MWKISEHKCGNNWQEMKVKILVKEMAKDSYATYAEQFENHFQQLIQEIKPVNNFEARHFYTVTQRNLKSVEIWKLTSEGDYKYKMFTLDFIEDAAA